jgi:polyhydroxybutyrate depolymerase
MIFCEVGMTASRLLWASAMTMTLVLGCGDDPAGDSAEKDAGEPPAELDAGDEEQEAQVPELLDCSASSALSAGDSTMTLSHGGVDRTFLLHVPASYDGKKLVPLVLDIHGLGGTPTYQRDSSGWLAKSDKEGFLLVHPQGLTNSWNAGEFCCGQSLMDKVDDEGFLRAVVAKLKKEVCVNPKRVYATGLSNGGAMSHLLACRAAEVFAAVAPVSMSNSVTPCEPSRGISVTMFRGTADDLVPYTQTPASNFLGAEADFDAWKAKNQCSGEVSKPNERCKTYTKCKDGADVTLCTIPTSTADSPWGGHLLYTPAIREGVNIPDYAWSVLQRHTL